MQDLWRPVELAIHVGVAQDGLEVIAGFGEGDGFYELLPRPDSDQH